jgi:GTP cyclohydrolase III
MKYVAILNTKDELTEDVINTLRLTFFMGGANGISYCFDFDSIKEVPDPMEYDDIVGIGGFYGGYNQALKDCGIEKEN